MKKSLIALAAVAATGAAMAQSSVTVYGVVDTSVGYVKGQDSVSGLLHSGNATSRLGFRGVEDLGNGLKAEFVLEGAINTDDGAGASTDAKGTATGGFDFKRQSTVGLTSNDFGTLRLGRALTASYNAVSRYDMFGTVGLGSTLAWAGVKDGGTGQFAYQTRSNNMVSYYSPKFAGFGVGIDYGFGEKTNGGENQYVGVGATYDNGPLSLGLGYDKQNNALGAMNATTTIYQDNAKTWQVGGSYDLAVVKLAAFYKETKFTDRDDASEKTKLKTWNLGISAPVGAAGVVKATYNNYKFKETSQKAQQFSLGYVHSLSKRTALYGTYSYLKNKNDGVFALNGAFTAAGLKDGKKQQGLQVGVRHAF